MATTQGGRVGYVGVGLRHDAPALDDAAALRAAGVPLEAASVGGAGPDGPGPGPERVTDLAAVRPAEVAAAALAGPVVFGGRYAAGLCSAAFAPRGSWGAGLVLASRWRALGVSHVHARGPGAAAAVAAHAAGLLGVGFSFDGHDAPPAPADRAGLSAALGRARFVACASEYHRRYYRALGADPARLKVVYRGADPGLFRPDPSAAPAGGPPRVVAAGRLVETSGFHDLIAACARLRDSGVRFECVVAGAGPERPRLDALVAAFRLGGVVRVTGVDVPRADLPGLIATARAFALPAVRTRAGEVDGLPTVLAEALLCGVPVVSTRLAGVPELVVHGETGLLVEPGDVPGLARALSAVVGAPAIAARLAEHGRERALAHFTRERSVARLSRLFAWCAANPGPDPPPEPMPAAPGASTGSGSASAEPALAAGPRR